MFCKISSCFDPYMDLYIEQEDRNMRDMLNNLTAAETWVVPEHESNKVKEGREGGGEKGEGEKEGRERELVFSSSFFLSFVFCTNSLLDRY